MITSVKIKFSPSINDFGKGRIYFQIIRNRVVRQFNPEIKISNNEWIGGDTPPYTSDNDVNKDINLYLSQISKCIDSLENANHKYTVDDVINSLSDNKYNLVDYIIKLSDRLHISGKFSSSEKYFNLSKRIVEFIGSARIYLRDIDCDFVESFEAFLLSKGMKRNTSSFYLRMLRAVWNKAIDAGLIAPTLVNPFKHVYTGVDSTKKRAISINDINNINRINLKAHPKLDFARDIFMFSFYTRGMNFIDIANLRKGDIQNGVITYKRIKTGKLLHVKVEKNIKRIIEKYSGNDSDYVFPIIKSIGNKYKEINNCLSRVNEALKDVGKYANVESNLTMYVARHSWATIAQNEAGVPLSVISKGLGHSNEQVTNVYLSSFGSNVIDTANRNVMKLIK